MREFRDKIRDNQTCENRVKCPRQWIIDATKPKNLLILAGFAFLYQIYNSPGFGSFYYFKAFGTFFPLFATTIATLLDNMTKETGSKFPYRKATLIAPKIKGKDNLDISKRWCIEFYIWNTAESKLERIRRDFDINKFKDVGSRKKRAEFYINIINTDLENGYVRNPTKKKKEGIPEGKNLKPEIAENEKVKSIDIDKITFSEAMKIAKEIKCRGKRKRTIDTYDSFYTVLKLWIDKNELSTMLFKHVSTFTLDSFFTFLIEGRKIGNRTYCNYLTFLTAFFNVYTKRKIILENPCSGIQRLKYDEGRNIAFEKDQIETLKAKIPAKNIYLWRFAQFIYYTLARPKELRELKIKNINLKTKKILIPSEVSKNHRNGYVIISKGLEKIIQEMELEKYDPDFFVFGKNGRPGPFQASRNYFTHLHIDLLKDLEFPQGCTLYSWKHTGAVAMLLAGINIKFISLQLRHSSLEETDEYLKSLGVNIDYYMDEEIISKAPQL